MYNMFNKLPHFVFLEKEKYYINTDYRIFIYLDDVMMVF